MFVFCEDLVVLSQSEDVCICSNKCFCTLAFVYTRLRIFLATVNLASITKIADNVAMPPA